jgi:Tol biopolymer transport system component
LGACRERPTTGAAHQRTDELVGTFREWNGKQLYVIGEQLKGELSRYDFKAGEFVPYLSGISAEFVDFSKDRQWVAYVTFPEQTLWRSRVDGSERLQLTSKPVRAVFPQWSPDGKRIAFFDVAPGKPWRIYLISSDGGVPERLLNESRNEMDPTWSQDGTSVAFSYFPLFDQTTSEKLGIFIVNVNNRSVQKVPGSDGLWAPHWSPDGRYLYYSRRGSDPAIVRIRLLDGAIEQVADLKRVRQTGFRSGFWMGLTPDDSPLVLRDIGTEEIYSLDLSTR